MVINFRTLSMIIDDGMLRLLQNNNIRLCTKHKMMVLSIIV